MENDKKTQTEEPTPIEKFNDDLRDYLATRYELTVLKTSQKAAIVASVGALAALLGVLVVLFILFISLAGGFYLSELVGSYGHGFAILSGIFLVLGLIVYIARRKWVLNPVRDHLIREMFNED